MTEPTTTDREFEGKELMRLLEVGGDDRSILGSDGVNKYFTSTSPTPSILHRGSCTSSSPTSAGFETALNALRDIRANIISYQDLMENIRSHLRQLVQLTEVASELIITPSGSDAELIPLLCAANRAHALHRSHPASAPAKVLSLIACAGEVGSGTAHAASGRHFSKVVPSGAADVAKVGDILEGFPALADISVCELVPRDNALGGALKEYDVLVAEKVDAFLADNPCGVVVLHLVEGSKTGLCMPSQGVMSELATRHGTRVLSVVDACQGRSTGTSIATWVRADACVLLTGSKFYNGPPFAAAVAVPKSLATELCTNLSQCGVVGVPPGLCDYFCKYDVPQGMPELRNALRDWENLSLALRWCASLHEMDTFHRADALHPGKVVHVAQAWLAAVMDIIKQNAYLRVVEESDVGRGVRLGECNTIVSFSVCTHPGPGTTPLDADALKLVHRWMWLDASGLLPPCASDVERDVASLRCTVGQPVKYGSAGVLRVCLGAPLVTEMVTSDSTSHVIATQDALIIKKAALCGKYYSHMAQAMKR